MERVVHISRSFEEAEQWNIDQNVAMTPDQRLEAAKMIRERVYGTGNPDIREYYLLAK